MEQLNEEKFITYWEQKRLQSKFNPFLFIKGFAGGLIIGLLILLSLFAGWYKRANMDASNKLSLPILFLSFLGIAIFLAVFYTLFKFEENEQLYQEILQRRKKSAEKNL